MTITVQVICDSISPEGIRLTTFQLRYPRFIHAEFMTHRVFSRNASSSRAIPVAKMIEDLKRDPARPIYWGSNKPGMQAGAELEEQDLTDAKNYWHDGMYLAIREAEKMIEVGLHKQIANRILEPWAHINVIVTATSYDNFFELRRHKDAQPEIKMLADLMHKAMQNSDPRRLIVGQWHLPFIRFWEWQHNNVELLKKVSTARCARVSYLTHDGRETTVEEDVALHDKLVVAEPLHASPAEHQATPDTWYDMGQASYGGPISSDGKWDHPELHGNFSGFCQYRKMLEVR